MSENSTKNKEAKTSQTAKEWSLEVTLEQYQTAKAKGIEDAALFKPGTHVFRRREPSKIVQKNQTTVVLNLDEKTFTYFKHAAETANGKTVESEITAELRNIVEKEAA